MAANWDWGCGIKSAQLCQDGLCLPLHVQRFNCIQWVKQLGIHLSVFSFSLFLINYLMYLYNIIITFWGELINYSLNGLNWKTFPQFAASYHSSWQKLLRIFSRQHRSTDNYGSEMSASMIGNLQSLRYMVSEVSAISPVRLNFKHPEVSETSLAQTKLLLVLLFKSV